MNMSFRQTKDNRNIEEIARWDESKKWQKKIEALKVKLADADVEVSKLSKDNKGKKCLHVSREGYMSNLHFSSLLKRNIDGK